MVCWFCEWVWCLSGFELCVGRLLTWVEFMMSYGSWFYCLMLVGLVGLRLDAIVGFSAVGV